MPWQPSRANEITFHLGCRTIDAATGGYLFKLLQCRLNDHALPAIKYNARVTDLVNVINGFADELLSGVSIFGRGIYM